MLAVVIVCVSMTPISAIEEVAGWLRLVERRTRRPKTRVGSNPVRSTRQIRDRFCELKLNVVLQMSAPLPKRGE